jgi:hypothetical protein
LKNLWTTRRVGIAMIELIFAIAVIGITLMSVPMLISTSSKSTYAAIGQESVTMVSSHLATLLTLQWDKGDTDPALGSPVLQTDSINIPACATPFPPGVSDNEGRYCRAADGNYYSASTQFGTSDPTDTIWGDDIDDYDQNETNITVYTLQGVSEDIATWEGDYIDVNVTLSTRVWYGRDYPRNAAGTSSPYAQTTTFSNPFDTPLAPGSGNTRNIKLIRVRLTTQNPAQELAGKQITMGAFMCNIGAPRAIVWRSY